MKVVKTLLLGAAAGLVAVTGASAADLAVTKPAPAEYVRVCSAEGAGFFYIPGTETCLKIGGRVRVDLEFSDAAAGGDFGWEIETSGLVTFDARTATSLGTLRSFLEISLNDDGTAGMGDAFISLGGFLVGRAQTLFGFDDPLYAKAGSVDQLQYVAVFGSGFYAGLGIEDRTNLVFDQEATGVLAIGYNNGGVHIRLAGGADTDENFGVQLQAQASFGAGTTVFASAHYLDGFSGAVGEVFGANLKLSQAFSDQFSANIGAGYEDRDGVDAFRVTAGADYTLVPGFVIGPEVTYEDVGGADSITGRFRFQRNF
jgi:Porin subfamily